MIWQKFLIPVQDGQGFRSLQDIISRRGAAPPIYRKEWQHYSLQWHGTFGW
jgi:hypothetical protein